MAYLKNLLPPGSQRAWHLSQVRTPYCPRGTVRLLADPAMLVNNVVNEVKARQRVVTTA